MMRRALALDEAHYGPDHPNVAMVLTNLAVLLEITGRPAEAEQLARRALAIDEVRFGADHPNVATNLTNLARILQAMNRPTEAEPLMQRARAIEQRQPSEPPKGS